MSSDMEKKMQIIDFMFVVDGGQMNLGLRASINEMF